MKHFRTHQPFTTWFTLWLLLLGMTLPLLGQAGMVPSQHIWYAAVVNSDPDSGAATEWVVICTSKGIERVRLDNGSPDTAPAPLSTPASPHSMTAGFQCLYCLLNDEENGVELPTVWGLLASLFQPVEPDRIVNAIVASEAPRHPVLWSHPPLPPRAPPLA